MIRSGGSSNTIVVTNKNTFCSFIWTDKNGRGMRWEVATLRLVVQRRKHGIGTRRAGYQSSIVDWRHNNGCGMRRVVMGCLIRIY